MRTATKRVVLICAVFALLVAGAGCGNDGDAAEPATSPSASTETAADPSDSTKSNSCPTGGCSIQIESASLSGEEIQLTFSANFDPDISKNHLHVYWDRFTAEQVSNDAETAHSVIQGQWVPTDITNEFTTEAGVSTTIREGSTTICVTAGDRDHNVIDTALTACRSVADLFPVG